MPTGRFFHKLINPCRDMPAKATAIHGHTNEILADKPVFAAIVQEFLEFIGDDTKLIAHNAPFDMAFVNTELILCGRDKLDMARVIDTLPLARKKFPGGQHTLDVLCGKCGVDNSRRVKHGALLDAELLAEVYVELMGGRQRGMALGEPARPDAATNAPAPQHHWPVRVFRVPDEEKERHRAFLGRMKAPIWQTYLGADA